MWHYGETMGFHSYIVRFSKNSAAKQAPKAEIADDPLAGITIIVLCNRTDISPESLALRIASLFCVSRSCYLPQI
jgi:hypothetical protein